MSELIDGIRAMPTWAQVGVGWFVLTGLVMLLSPGIEYRRHSRRFKRLAQDLGATVDQGGDQWPLSFSVTVDGRHFRVEYNFLGSSRDLDLRPSGHVLITTTPLAGSGWGLHDVDIVPGAMPRWLRPKNPPPGAPSQDAPFLLRSSGEQIRPGWFDAGCRAAVTAFCAFNREVGPLQVREQALVHRTSAPWPARSGDTLRELLQHQAAVAASFERTARLAVV